MSRKTVTAVEKRRDSATRRAEGGLKLQHRTATHPTPSGSEAALQKSPWFS